MEYHQSYIHNPTMSSKHANSSITRSPFLRYKMLCLDLSCTSQCSLDLPSIQPKYALHAAILHIYFMPLSVSTHIYTRAVHAHIHGWTKKSMKILQISNRLGTTSSNHLSSQIYNKRHCKQKKWSLSGPVWHIRSRLVQRVNEKSRCILCVKRAHASCSSDKISW